MDQDVPEVRERMTEAVRRASRVCRRVQSSLRVADATTKDDRSPVTVADLAAQVLVVRALAATCPGIPVVGEEDASILRGDAAAPLRGDVLARVREEWPDATEDAALAALDRGGHGGGASGRFFVLDPIDGTKGFLRGEQYAIALALVEEGRVVAGVLGCPNLADEGGGRGLLLHAVRGGGTTVSPIDGTGTAGAAARASARSDPRSLRLCESVEAGHSDRSASTAVLARLGATGEPVRMDSQAKYGLLALGRGDLYLRTPTKPGRSEWIWDHAAGVIVLEEAGGCVTDLDGAPLDFSRGRTLAGNRGIVATNGRLHDAVMAALRE